MERNRLGTTDCGSARPGRAFRSPRRTSQRAQASAQGQDELVGELEASPDELRAPWTSSAGERQRGREALHGENPPDEKASVIRGRPG